MEHNESCGCGHVHHHAEDHHHGHVHGPDCGCGGEIEIAPADDLTILQQNMLLALYARRYLPVARFALESTRDGDAYAIALAPVYLGTAEDTMDAVKQLGEELEALEQAGLITLDYDIPLNGYAYEEYKTSILYGFFQQSVEESSEQPDALFDRAALEKGSMALTDKGTARVEKMLG